ncbi:hypothetical protein B0H13DRAFT_2361682 [Mycena leptocephala]|nr:hypothetical protein B0H13DRAFT_2361682 [Mycena leptocephala]
MSALPPSTRLSTFSTNKLHMSLKPFSLTRMKVDVLGVYASLLLHPIASVTARPNLPQYHLGQVEISFRTSMPPTASWSGFNALLQAC